MPNFKNSKNDLFWLDDNDDPSIWLPGCILITDAEADTIRERNRSSRLYTELRLAEYPPFTDYLDGIVKGDEAQVTAYIEACMKVKNKYPKQDGP